MMQVIHYQNEKVEKAFEPFISDAYGEVRKLLPKLPQTIQIYFGDSGIIPESGIGGFAYSPDIITISIDPGFKDKKKQQKEIRPTIFHESFHIFQNYTGKTGPFSAIDNAIYEGMATVFEREYCGIWQPYGDYRKTPVAKLKGWVENLQKLSLEEFTDNYSAWKFYHPKLKERWIVYKTGMWMVDRILKQHKLNIIDLSESTAAEVLELYNQ